MFRVFLKPDAQHVSEQEQQTRRIFNFWWPTGKTSQTFMVVALWIIGILGFVKGCMDVRLGSRSSLDAEFAAFVGVLIFYVAANLIGWYLVINMGRFVYSRITESGLISAVKESRREKAELGRLRRKAEIKKLREELGEDGGETK